MKLLLIHADFIEYEAKERAVSEAEEIKEKKRKVEEALVVFCGVENGDDLVLDKVINEIRAVADQIGVRKIVIYPFVHLTQQPAKPKEAMEILKKLEKDLSKLFETYRAPFGWYKSFTLKCKGHPLAELSRTISPEKEISQALKAEQVLISYWYILDKNGLHEIKLEGDKIKGYDFTHHENLEKFAKYEMKKSRVVEKEPPHVWYMRKLEIADYEDASDPGNLRYYPKGRFMRKLISLLIERAVSDYGALEVETPIMYDSSHPIFKKYFERFPARQYVVLAPKKRMFLRFAACPGQFFIMGDATLSYKHLPLKLYELAYSFRAEKKGELTGLRRLRAFTMPDCHAICQNIEQAKEEMKRRFEISYRLMKNIGFDMPGDFEMAIRVTKAFWNEHKDFVMELQKMWGKPILLEMWDEKFFYFVLKYEWNFVDNLDKATALTTDQIDVDNAKDYGIMFVDKDGTKKYPLILHWSPTGAIERVIYALLEKAHRMEKPSLPLWLSPTMVRIIPMNKKYLEKAEAIAKELEIHGIRVDIDDTDDSLGRKVKRAEQEWIPYYIVIGERELNKSVYPVTVRGVGKKEMDIEELVQEIKEKTRDLPKRPLPLPKYLSIRPTFVGAV